MRTHTQLFACSSLLGMATLLTLIESRGAGKLDARRWLLISATNRYPEVHDWFRRNESAQRAATQLFEDVIVLNDEIFPVHPVSWRPEQSLGRHRRRWLARLGIRRLDTLVLESLHRPPALTVAKVFAESEIVVCSDTLATYGPTLGTVPPDVERRITELHYLDIIPGARPLLLREAHPELHPVGMDALKCALERVSDPCCLKLVPSTAVLLGQPLSHMGIVSPETQVAWYVDALRDLRKTFGAERVAFKPHPLSEAPLVSKVARLYGLECGAPLSVIDASIAIERIALDEPLAAVAGVFSTGLFTAHRVSGIAALTVQTKNALAALPPSAQIERLPLVAADIMLPSLVSLLRATQSVNDLSVRQACHSLMTQSWARMDLFAAAQGIVGCRLQPSLSEEYPATAENLAARLEVRHLDLYLGEPGCLPTQSATPQQSGLQAPAPGRLARLSQRVLGEKKAAKLADDPVRYFADSRRPAVRLAGHILGRPLRLLLRQ